MSEKWPDLAGRIEGETHVLPVRVYFEDTDFAGVVYHANFLKFCERGRSDFIRLLGIDAKSLAEPGAGRAVGVRRAPRRDRLSQARPHGRSARRSSRAAREIGSASLVLQQDVRRDGTLLVRARVTVVLVSSAGKPQRLGALVRNALQRFVNQPRET